MKILAKDGKWYRTGEFVACCDCELTHRVEFKIKYIEEEPRLYMRMTRDMKRTEKNRKVRGIKITSNAY